MSKYTNKILDAFKNGKINSYLAEKLEKALNDDIDEDTVDFAISDAQEASDMGVQSNDEYVINYNLNRYLDDILDDTFDISLENQDKQKLKKFIYENRKNKKYDLTNLTDLRILIHQWLTNNLGNKKAYPNVGLGIHNRGPSYDITRWIDALKKIYELRDTGRMDKLQATNTVISEWNATEQYQFLQWMKFYEGGNSMKYNVKNANFTMPGDWIKENRDEKYPQLSTFQAVKDKQKNETVSKRKKMRSRVHSIRKLLGDYSDLNQSNSDDLMEVLDLLSKLEVKIISLKSEAMVKSSIVKTANIMSSKGFGKNAIELYKLADETPVRPTEQATTPPKSNNPQEAIAKLENISSVLKNRQVIRELARIDLELADLGIASYFTEIGDSQSKLIEAFGYASNRIESVIAKLRGTGGNEATLKQDGQVEQKKLQDKEMANINKSKEVLKPENKNTQTSPTQAPQENLKKDELMNKPVSEPKNTLPQ